MNYRLNVSIRFETLKSAEFASQAGYTQVDTLSRAQK